MIKKSLIEASRPEKENDSQGGGCPGGARYKESLHLRPVSGELLIHHRRSGTKANALQHESSLLSQLQPKTFVLIGKWNQCSWKGEMRIETRRGSREGHRPLAHDFGGPKLCANASSFLSLNMSVDSLICHSNTLLILLIKLTQVKKI